MLNFCVMVRLRLHMVVVEVHPRWIGTAAATVGAVHLLDGLTIVVCIISSQVCLFYVISRFEKKKKKLSVATFFIW